MLLDLLFFHSFPRRKKRAKFLLPKRSTQNVWLWTDGWPPKGKIYCFLLCNWSLYRGIWSHKELHRSLKLGPCTHETCQRESWLTFFVFLVLPFCRSTAAANLNYLNYLNVYIFLAPLPIFMHYLSFFQCKCRQLRVVVPSLMANSVMAAHNACFALEVLPEHDSGPSHKYLRHLAWIPSFTFPHHSRQDAYAEQWRLRTHRRPVGQS